MHNRNKRISRRQFIKGIGALVVVSAAAGISCLNFTRKDGVSAAETDKADRQWVMVIDLRRCDGCKQCTKACQEDHYLPEEHEWIKVYKLEGAFGQFYYMPVPCMQCENAPCVRVCPVKATYKTKEGVTLVDANKCIGCRMCMAACPYHVRYFNWDKPPETPPDLFYTPEYPVPQKKGTVGKCEFCTHLTHKGKLPQCVEACYMDAVYLGDLISDVATNRVETVKLSTLLKDNDAFRFKEGLNTKPRVWYIAGHGQDYVE